MAWVDDLNSEVDAVFGAAFDERTGRKVPSSDDVALANGAVKVDAAFLYADLAGSGALAAACPWTTTAKILRAYLKCATRLMRAYGGEVRSFDGDRVMAVFMGEAAAAHAIDCAREIFWTTENIIQVKARKAFTSVANNNLTVRQACGVDVGTVRAVRAGIRNNNDLIWIGRAPSLSAKLSDIREFPYCTFITKVAHDQLPASSRNYEGQDLWEVRTVTFAGAQEVVFRSKWTKRP